MKAEIYQREKSEMQATANELAKMLHGKCLPLKGCIPGTSRLRGIAIIPNNLRGEQASIHAAIAIVQEL